MKLIPQTQKNKANRHQSHFPAEGTMVSFKDITGLVLMYKTYYLNVF